MGKRANSTTSTSSKIKAVENATKQHDWPVEAGACTQEAWSIYIKNQCFRSFDDWNAADLIELARVSNFQAMAIEEFEKLMDEGIIVMGGKSLNTPVENPRNRALSTLNSTISNSLRRLGITASNSGGSRSTRAQKATAERTAAGALKGDETGDETRSGRSLM